MKKLIVIILFFVIQTTAAMARAPLSYTPSGPDTGIMGTLPSMPCVTNKILVNPTIDGSFEMSLNNIRDVFEHYTEPARRYLSSSGRYELCFEFSGLSATNGALPISSPLIFNKATDSKDVYIKGLKLKSSMAGSSFLFIIQNNDRAKVTLDESVLLDATYGLRLNGYNINVTGSQIHGQRGDGAGTCVYVDGDYGKITGTEISNCDNGIFIPNKSNNFFGAESEISLADMNDIHDNGIGIEVTGGYYNRFPFNKIYNNMEIAGTITSADAIFYEPVYLRFLEEAGFPVPKRPEIVLIDPATEQALHCDKDDTGRVVKRWLQFIPVSINAGQEIIIYATNVSQQAVNYLAKCNVDAEGKCTFIFPSSYTISDTQCGVPDLFAVALINATDYTSMLTTRRFLIDGVVALGSDAADIVDAIPAGGMTGGVAGGGPVTVADSSSTGGDIGGSSGAKGAMCTLIAQSDKNTTVTSGLTMWWIIFTAPAVLVAVRIKKRK